ncbi:MAG: bile acid:sodium symporter family protein, partial [Runella zeae]
MPHRLSIVLLILAGCALAGVGVFWMLDYFEAIGPFVLIGLTGLALAFRGFERLKGFSYTLWILIAVSLAMFYPAYFFTVGDFQLKRLIVPFVQLTMFGMGAHMSLEEFS